jgi:predicted O-methyltransferase YrrM
MARKENRPVPFPKIVHGVPGLLHRREANFLYDVPARLGDGLYVELGCLHGRSAVCVGGGIQEHGVKGHLYAVDTFKGLHGSRDPNIWEQEVNDRFESKGLSSIITTVRGDTSTMAADFQDKEFNFIFIDADHSYEGAKADFEAWSPLLRSGGEIAFHDTHYPGVLRLLEEIPKEWKRGELIKSLTVITKP